MTDQWFLDLDGTRSGPYQTNEILSLIAEGEVLPHHRIARGLKDPNWKTILDWRLEHARQAPAPAAKTPPSEKPVAPPARKPSPPPSPPPAEKPVAAPPVEDSVLSPAQMEFKKEIEALERNTVSMPPPQEGAKRDPMAEMFDLLQNTRHKREAKQIQQAQQSSQESPGVPDYRGPNPLRWIFICGVIAVIGLALGQWFRYSTRKPGEPAAPEAKVETKKDGKEVIDRSTDKLTIRTVVEKKPEPAKIPTPFPKSTPHPVAAHPAASHGESRDEKKHTEKELEELRDLKKELQELKALKEQLRDGAYPDDSMEGDIPPFNPDAGPSPSPGAGESQAGTAN